MMKATVAVSAFCFALSAASLSAGEVSGKQPAETPAAQQHVDDYLAFMEKNHPDKMPAVTSAAKRSFCPLLWDFDKPPESGFLPPMC